MGIYVNPVGCTKETFLLEKGEALHVEEIRTISFDALKQTNRRAVCLVSNGYFTAAAVCYSQRELEDCRDTGDRRAKLWFAVRVEDLIDVCPEFAQYLVTHKE